MSFGGDEIDQMLEASHQKTRSGRSPHHAGRDRTHRRRGGRSRSRERYSRRGGGRPVDDRFLERGYSDIDRDERTVFAFQIHPRMDERDLFDFFSNVGRVIDIQLIRDNRTFKSKGLAYIEFAERASINAALQLSGQPLGGHPISVQLTQAEKNRAAQQAATRTSVQRPMRLYIGNIHPKVIDKDLEPVFAAFGDILHLEIDKDRRGRSKGTGFVEFRKENEAVGAVQQLHGLEILGQSITVSSTDKHANAREKVIHDMAVGPSADRLEEEDGNGGLNLTTTGRMVLMRKLARSSGELASFPLPGQNTYSNVPSATPNGAPPVASTAPVARQVDTGNSSSCVLLINMFDPSTETDPDFDFEIREDVSEEVKKYGNLVHIYVDKSNPQGLIYLKFSHSSEAAATVSALSGRWFARNQIKASIVPEAEYKARFGNV